MNLRQVEAFRAIIRHGTMTEAANNLRTSQPSISRLIAELEDSTGLQLFERRGGRVSPTDDGLAFYAEVERSFAGLADLAQAAGEIAFFGKGRLRIGTIPAMAVGLVPDVIAQLGRHHPHVAVSIQMHNEVSVTRWVASRYCDLGFVANVIEAPGLEVHPLYRLAGLCALPRHHRLAGRKLIRPADLAGESFVSLALGDGARTRTDRVFESRNVPRRMAFETPYGAIICSLVARGVGVGIVNPLVAAQHTGQDVAFVPFRPSVLFYGYIIMRRDRVAGSLVDAIAAIARTQTVSEDRSARAEP